MSYYSNLPDNDLFANNDACSLCGARNLLDEFYRAEADPKRLRLSIWPECQRCDNLFCEDCLPKGANWNNVISRYGVEFGNAFQLELFNSSITQSFSVRNCQWTPFFTKQYMVLVSCPFCDESIEVLGEMRSTIKKFRTINFESRLSTILEKVCEPELKASVAIVQKGLDKWLLGLSTASDDRKNKWAFPGGGIKKSEKPEKAAVRECREETGVRCKSVGEYFKFGDKKHVAFVHCKVVGTIKLDNNSEFAALGFFTLKEMDSLKLYRNVRNLIKRVQSC
jgi:ADP-ribose pyrophosphatase YjhB (NUDIX family)